MDERDHGKHLHGYAQEEIERARRYNELVMSNKDTNTLIIEHKIGNEIYTQRLTIPHRRRFKNVYQIRLTLLGTDPPVWRRILVPESYTFYDLHVAIQDVMDWEDYHLHHFQKRGDDSRAASVHIECPWFNPFEMNDKWLITTEVPIKKLLEKSSDQAIYRYDYGDGWEMDIMLEAVLPREKNKTYLVCVEGRLAAPLEDSGGIPGYYRCIEALKAVEDLENRPELHDDVDMQELIIWMGDWDPQDFDPEDIVFENPRDRFKKAVGD
jgi:hypothetical protein